MSNNGNNFASELDGLATIKHEFTYDDGKYVVKEASSGTAIEYRNKVGTITAKEDKRDQVSELQELRVWLVNECLTKGGQAVTHEELLDWPDRALIKVYNVIITISELRNTKTNKDEDENRLGESLSKTESGSTLPVS